MPLFDRAQAADYFALGCTIAEIYSRAPLFSQRSIVDYLLAYVDATPSPSSSPTGPDHLATGGDGWIIDVATSMLGASRPAASESSPWNASILLKLAGLPYNIKVRERCQRRSNYAPLLIISFSVMPLLACSTQFWRSSTHTQANDCCWSVPLTATKCSHRFGRPDGSSRRLLLFLLTITHLQARPSSQLRSSCWTSISRSYIGLATGGTSFPRRGHFCPHSLQ